MEGDRLPSRHRLWMKVSGAGVWKNLDSNQVFMLVFADSFYKLVQKENIKFGD